MGHAGAAGALSILYRGPLDSCNYACAYCPFAKRAPRTEVLAADRAALGRFVAWAVSATTRPLRILITPWGEALVHAWYRQALLALSRLPHVELAAIQTNGSASMAWARRADRSRLALWITWHPSEVAHERFVAQALALRRDGVRLSVGCVAVPARLAAIEAMRRALPADVPMWINALRPGGRYSPAEVERWTAIDPDFPVDLHPHASRGRACRTGEDAIAVDGDGTVRRCHFVPAPLGNLYRDDLAAMLRPRACPRARCDCFIGYAHLEHLRLAERFGVGLLARLRG